MKTFQIELDEAQEAALSMFADAIDLTSTECIKMLVLLSIRVQTMIVTDTHPGQPANEDDALAILDMGMTQADQIIGLIKTARDVPEGFPFDTPDQPPIS